VCGIAGLMMRNGRAPEARVLDLLQAAIAHRGPDGKGRFVRDATGLVSTRLAIVDLLGGDQPLHCATGAVLVANGEIYNDPELRAEMREAEYRTGSDCESPLHIYCRSGLEFVNRLRGMYAIAIYEPADGSLILSRDPFGIKPLYYVEAPGCFAFASEPQALIGAGLARRHLNPLARAELFQLKFTIGSETIFSDIHRVLPGETIVIRDAAIVERRVRSALPGGGPREISHEAALQQLDRIMLDTVNHHLRSDVPYGLFLSGGVDSSSLLRVMSSISSRPVVAFTASFPGSRAADESDSARRVAASVGAEHHVIAMTAAEFWNTAPRVAAALDDPTTDAATLPTFALAEKARQFVKVVLSGEGGDEMFCGYSRYLRASRFGGLFGRHARRRGEFRSASSVDGAVAGWRSRLAMTEAQEARGERTFMQVLQAVDCAQWLPNDLLLKLDRCLMSNAIEGRTPFLDPVVAEFAFRLPDKLKVGNGQTKRLLRDWLSWKMPISQPYAKKLGFNAPLGEWIGAKKDALYKLVAQQPGVAEIFTAADIEYAFSDLDKRHQAAWTLVFYALWHSHHVLEVAHEGNIGDVLEAARRAA
jgi:asparagine synthase (glutamine-hydrolysing)